MIHKIPDDVQAAIEAKVASGLYTDEATSRCAAPYRFSPWTLVNSWQ